MDYSLKIINRKEDRSDLSYWLTKSYAERLEVIEFLRHQYIKYTHASERLQKVCRVVNRKQG